MNQTMSLYRLQLIDSQKDRAQAHLQAIQKKREDDAILREFREQAGAAEQRRQSAGQALHLAETAVQDQRIKIEQSEASLYGGVVRNPKELQDLENDVASLKRHMETLEDRLLEAMLALEEADKSLQASQSTLQAAEERWALENQNLDQEQGSLEKELQKLLTERNALAGTISDENINLYDQLRQQRRGVAVVTISDNSCDACGAKLTPAQGQNVRSAAQMARCPSCGRILYGN